MSDNGLPNPLIFAINLMFLGGAFGAWSGISYLSYKVVTPMLQTLEWLGCTKKWSTPRRTEGASITEGRLACWGRGRGTSIPWRAAQRLESVLRLKGTSDLGKGRVTQLIQTSCNLDRRVFSSPLIHPIIIKQYFSCHIQVYQV